MNLSSKNIRPFNYMRLLLMLVRRPVYVSMVITLKLGQHFLQETREVRIKIGDGWMSKPIWNQVHRDATVNNCWSAMGLIHHFLVRGSCVSKLVILHLYIHREYPLCYHTYVY